MQNATMLYKLGGPNKHYEPKIGYIDYDYIIVDESEIQDYIAQGWGLNLTEMYLDSKLPSKEIILPESSEQSKNKGKKTEVSDNNL